MGAAQNQGTIVQLDLQHPNLRNCKTRTTANSIDLLVTIPSQFPTYKKWKESLEIFTSSLTNLQYLLLPINERFDEGGVCSTSGQLNLEYDYYPRLLISEITLRKKQSKKFTEGQLWYLLYVLTIVKFKLAENGEAIGDVHPRNIFLNGTGDVKIACLHSWPGQVGSYRHAILQQQCGYLAPEDIERLKLGAMDNKINSQSEIFAIGLVLLNTANLQSQQDLYQMREKEFKEDILLLRLGKFQHDTTYSEIFRAVVSNLLEIQPLKRMNLLQLKTLLQKHSENIIAKKPLRIDNVEKKLQKTISIMFKAIRPQSKNEAEIQNKDILLQQNVKESNDGMKFTGQKIKNFINFEQTHPSQNSKSFPQPSFVTAIKMSSSEDSHQPTINKVFSSTITATFMKKNEQAPMSNPVIYNYSYTISNKRQPQGSSSVKLISKQQMSMYPKEAEQVKIVEKIKPQQIKGQKATMTQIQHGEQTSIGQLNLLMDTKRKGLENNSLITPKYEPESVQKPLDSLRPSIEPEFHQLQSFEKKQEPKQNLQQRVVKEESAENQSQLSKKSSPIQNSLMKSSDPSHSENHSAQNKSLLKINAKESEIDKLDIHQEIKPQNNLQSSQNNNYILIQQDSKHTAQPANQPSVIKLQKNLPQKYEEIIQQQQSQIIQYHTYVEITTEGTFQDCWQEILAFLKDPTNYSTLIYTDKVKARIIDDRWSLKVGPGIFDIFLNKQQGKFLLKNCEQSSCKGEMLGGVYKDRDKHHRIWFNSAYYYKDHRIPSKQIIDDCLKTCKDNIAKLKK